MIKYAANAFLATKISFINEIANLSDRLGATIDEVIKGISLDPRIGSSFLRAGLGYGGSCFPKDIRALDFFSTANGHDFQLLRSVITVNNRQRLLPLRVLRQVFGSLQNIPVTVLGLAFKPGTGDMRESPALDIIDLLLDDGADVRATDPMVDASASGVLPEGVAFFKDPMDALQHASAAVLVSEWPHYTDLDWGHVSRIMRKPRLIFDGRNALDQNLLQSLGFSYRGIGRGAFANTTTSLN
jgi:UDPglucose 6-dehydrogenase